MTGDQLLEYLNIYWLIPLSLLEILVIRRYGTTWRKLKKRGTNQSGIYIFSNVQISSKLLSFKMSAVIASVDLLRNLLGLLEGLHFIPFPKTSPTQNQSRLRTLKVPQ